MQEDWTPTQVWIADQVERFVHRRLSQPPAIFRDTSNFMGIDRDDVVDLDGELYLVTCTEQERRFGLEGEPKFWVKRALALTTGRMHIVKLVFNEVFYAQIRTQQIKCVRSAEKEGRVLDLTRGDPRFMQGHIVPDSVGNLVRVIEFIHGVDLLSRLASLNAPHEEYFHTRFPEFLARTIACFEGIQLLHDAGLCHGDIRNDHILIEHQTGGFKWIDFDLMQDSRDFDVWALGNILHCVVAKGFVTFREVLRDRPELLGQLHPEDASVFFPNRVMNLRKIYPYLPAKLNDVLVRFSVGKQPGYETVRQIVDDLNDCLAGFGRPVALEKAEVATGEQGQNRR